MSVTRRKKRIECFRVKVPAVTRVSSIPNAHQGAHGYFEVRPSDVAAKSGLLFVDVRDEEELLGSDGHIHGVTHVGKSALYELVMNHPLDGAPIVLVCQNGRRSAQLATDLVKEFPDRRIHVLVGGMQRWIAEERPIARTKTYV